MPKITFVDYLGRARDVTASEGLSLMEAGRDAGIVEILADCGGACACATCHVYVDEDWLDRVGPPDAMEADMLEFAAAPTDRRSRLSCQIPVTSALEGLVVHTPKDQG